MLQTVLGKLYPISLFVTLYVLSVLRHGHRRLSSLSLREGRATLAGAANRTHFPTLTGASRNVVAAWSVRPVEVDPNDVSKLHDMPVRPPKPSSNEEKEPFI